MKNYPLGVNSCSSLFSNDNQQVSQVSPDDISSDEKKVRHTMAAVAVANNIHYSQAIFLKNIAASIDNNVEGDRKNQEVASAVAATVLVPVPAAYTTTTTTTPATADRSEMSADGLVDDNNGNHPISISTSMYRLGHSDTWACKNCRQKGDKWYMQQHLCRGSV
jgi:hypothetical protein